MPPRVNLYLKRIQFIAFDFDGIFTDNRVYVDSIGREMVCCSRSDGIGLSMLRELGIPMVILSSEKNRVVQQRARKLGIRCVQGLKDKSQTFQKICQGLKVPLKYAAFLGNDLNDLSCLQLAGIPIAVSDAHQEVKRKAKLLLTRKGGDGAVRELCERIYKVKKGLSKVV